MAARLAGAGGGAYALKQNADINVTPFVDILLVLLIIFMVAVPMATTAIKLDMPLASDKVAPRDPVFISIQESGALFLAGRPTSLDTLSRDLGARFAADQAERESGPAGTIKYLTRYIGGLRDKAAADFAASPMTQTLSSRLLAQILGGLAA